MRRLRGVKIACRHSKKSGQPQEIYGSFGGRGFHQVGLAQCPLYFHELAEELDYLDGSLAGTILGSWDVP